MGEIISEKVLKEEYIKIDEKMFKIRITKEIIEEITLSLTDLEQEKLQNEKELQDLIAKIDTMKLKSV